MPIIGFRRERMPRLGKIHLGEKTVNKNGKEYPKDTGFFHLPPEIAAVYGADTVKELTIMVPSADISKFFPYGLKRYANDKLICRGDGETATCFNHETGEWDEQPCRYKDCQFYQDKKCTEVGNLMVILPDYSIVGVVQIDTGSWHGINNFYNTFENFVQRLTDITGSPDVVLRVKFTLTRKEQILEFVDNGVRKTVTKAILELVPPPLSYDAALQLAEHFQRAPMLNATAAHPQLPAPMPINDIPAETLLPDPDEAPMPKDLYPGATPAGPDMGQRNAWIALLELAQNMGKNVAAIEKSVVQMTSPGAATFNDLTGAEEAPEALSRLSSMLENWATQSPVESRSENGNGQKTAPATGEVQTTAPATTVPVAEVIPAADIDEGKLEF